MKKTTTKTSRKLKLDKQVDTALEKIADKPFLFILKFNGKIEEFKSDNILQALKNLSAKGDFLKTMIHMEVQYRDKVFFRVFRVPVFRMLLQNDTRKVFMAKIINQTLGIFGNNLYI